MRQGGGGSTSSVRLSPLTVGDSPETTEHKPLSAMGLSLKIQSSFETEEEVMGTYFEKLEAAGIFLPEPAFTGAVQLQSCYRA